VFKVCYPQLTLVPSLHIDLTGDLSVFNGDDDMLEDMFPIREGAVDTERDPIRGDHFVGYGDIEIRAANPPQEISDLLLTDHPVGGTWWRDMPIFDPFGFVRVERQPTLEVFTLKGVLESGEVELGFLFGHCVILSTPLTSSIEN
jgi:hypothetical protein